MRRLLLEEWLRGLRHWFAKSAYKLYCTVGSNPISSFSKQQGAKHLLFEQGFLVQTTRYAVLVAPFFLSSFESFLFFRFFLVFFFLLIFFLEKKENQTKILDMSQSQLCNSYRSIKKFYKIF
jgi:cellulose synthase/poly-beta-1,6-N-acetylglucosamine synthase-like glycosyltransferase